MTLTDAVVVLTGGTTGIGRAVALRTAGEVGHLIVHGPQPRAEVSELLDELPAGVTYLQADFSTLAEVRRLAGDIGAHTDRIDLLINNAARPGPPQRTVSADGNELTLQTNYLAPVALTSALMPLITGRVVNIASATHLSARLRLDDLQLTQHPYAASTAYAHSKLALVTYTCWLAANLPKPGVEVVSMHPGVISTELLHAMFAVTGDTPAHAAANILEVCARSHDNGTYYDETRPATPNPEATTPAVQQRLHTLTNQLLQRAVAAGAPRPPDP